MLPHLVVTLALAVLACVILWAAARLLGRPVPRYLLPMAAAAVTIGYGMYVEYTWSGRTEAALPASFVVVQRAEGRSALSPWSFVVPRTVRFSAIDAAAVRRHPGHPELRLLQVLLFERFHPVRSVAQLVDCARGRRADIVAGEALGADGLPEDAPWRAVGLDDRIVSAACAAAAA